LGHINKNLSSTASTQEQEEHLAVADIAEQLRSVSEHNVFLFCSSRYSLSRLKDALNQRFEGNVIGCTGAGLLGPRGFQRSGITAVSLAKSAFRIESFLLKPLSEYKAQIESIARTVNSRSLAATSKKFGVLLVDGLSKMEEELAAELGAQLPNIPIVGGSAGDDLRLRETHVWLKDSFHSDAAVLTLVTTDLPFQPLQVHHFVPGRRTLEITSADPKNRTIFKINGEAAALAYADLVDVSLSDLNPNVFSKHPLLLEHEGKYYVRSIQRVNSDGSLIMYSAIEAGQKPWIGEPRDPLTVLGEAFDSLPENTHDPALVIGFDCVLRRLEFEQRRIDATVGKFMADHNVIGFCTYGEQYDSRHINQTFTGVAIKPP
jgi:hypothetical protein